MVTKAQLPIKVVMSNYKRIYFMKFRILFFLFLFSSSLLFSQDVPLKTEYSELWLNISEYISQVGNHFHDKNIEQLIAEYGEVKSSKLEIIDNRYSVIDDVLYKLSFDSFDIDMSYISHGNGFLVYRVILKKPDFIKVWGIDIGTDISVIKSIFGDIPLNKKALGQSEIEIYTENGTVTEITVHFLE